MSETLSRRLRGQLVRDLERRGFVRSRAVRDAFLAVPRERFLPQVAGRDGLAAVYRDDAFPTRFDERGLPISSSSQPAIMAEMLEQLAVASGQRVLEVGAGTGYNAALLAELVGPAGSVVSVDLDAEIAREARRALRSGGHRVRVVVGDGRDGFPPGAQYDRIVVTASATEVPRTWLEQLGEGGLLELPLRLDTRAGQLVATFRREARRLVSVALVPGGFMPLRGEGLAFEPPPSVTATDAFGGRGPLLAQVSGPALGTLTRAARRRLLATALSDGRRRPLGLRADADALVLYLGLTLPASRLVVLFPSFALGVIGRDGRSLASVEPPSGRGARVTSVTARGGDEAERFLRDAVRRWDERGRPGGSDLRLVVDHDRHGGVPRLRR